MADYTDLEINLGYCDGESYTFELRFRDPDSHDDIPPYRGPVHIDFDSLRQSQLSPEAYGQCLTNSLFDKPEALAEFKNACIRTLESDKTLRLRLHIDRHVSELHSLRWETLRDPRSGAALLTSERILFSRFLPSSESRPVKLRAKGDLRALVVIANPTNVTAFNSDGRQLAEVRVQDELERAHIGLGEFIKREIVSDPADPGRASLNNVIAALRDGYDILYLVCHGILRQKANIEEPLLLLEKRDGSADDVRGIDLIIRLRNLVQQPWLVVLASCQSAGRGDVPHSADQGVLAALGPRLADAGIPAVVAMQGNVSMNMVAEFMSIFFERLSMHGQVDQAMAAARSAVERQYNDYWWMPVLFMRLREGRIWYAPGFRGDRFEKWPALLRRIHDGKCTPILGSGVLESILGSSREIAQHWADTYHFPMAPHNREDLPQVAQWLMVHQDGPFPYEELTKYVCQEIKQRYGNQLPAELRQASEDQLDQLIEAVVAWRQQQNPAEPHRVLGKLPFKIYITTNPDNLLVKALEEADKKPYVALCPWNEDLTRFQPTYEGVPTADEPLVYHLFGQIHQRDSLVLTEDDYFEYLIGVASNNNLIPEVVRAAQRDSLLLFLGFQLDDWSFRVLFQSIMRHSKSGRLRRYGHVAVQLVPEEDRLLEPERARWYLEKYFGKKDINISIYWGNVEDFLGELRTEWNKLYGREKPI
jgi:hypothetical protein